MNTPNTPPYILARIWDENGDLKGQILSRHDTLRDAAIARCARKATMLGSGTGQTLIVLDSELLNDLIVAHGEPEEVAKLGIPDLENVRYHLTMQ